MNANHRFLLVCSCSGSEKKAQMAYDIIFPNTPTPQIIKGKDAIFKLASKYKNDHLKAIAKIKGMFTYFVEISESGKIVKEINLITGKVVK